MTSYRGTTYGQPGMGGYRSHGNVITRGVPGMTGAVRELSRVVSSAPKERERSPPGLVLPDAHIRWGQPSEFEISEFVEKTRGLRLMRPERGPLWGDYYEEARTWTDFPITNPENPNDKVIVRTTSQIAFRAPNESTSYKREEQITFSFNNSYTKATPVPAYLRNRKNELFDPIVLDPFSRIVEVGWPADDFVLITLMFKPYTNVDLKTQLDIPGSYGVYTPGDDKGGEYGNVKPPPAKASEPDTPFPFMEVWHHGNVEDPTDTIDAGKLMPQGGSGPDGDQPPFMAFEDRDRLTKGEVLIALPYGIEYDHYIKTHSPAAAYCGGVYPGFPYSTIFKEPVEGQAWWPSAIGCYSGYASEITANPDPEPRLSLHILNPPSDGEVFVQLDLGDGVKKYGQWKLDYLAEHTLHGAGPGRGILTAEKTSRYPATYNAYAIYRKYETGFAKKYDADAFVYALFIVNASFINFFFRQDLFEMQDLPQISIWAGGAANAQGIDEDDNAHFVPASGELRWCWQRGFSREACEELKNIEFPPTDDEPDKYPSYKEVWNALYDGTGYLPADIRKRINEGRVNEATIPVAATTSIEGGMNVLVRFMIEFASASLTGAGTGGSP